MASEKIDDTVAIKVDDGMASLPRRLWRARNIAGRVALRSLKQNPETGRWRCRVTDTVTGRFESVDTPYRDKRHAWEFAIKFAWTWARDHGLVDRGGKDGDFMIAWRRWIREQPVRPITAYNYELVGRFLSKHLPESVAAITRTDVLDMVKHCQTIENSGNTIAWKMTIFRMFLRWARMENYIDIDPTKYIRGPRFETRIGIGLSYEEARRLLATAKKREIRKHGKFFRRYQPMQHLYWFILISLHTGLRKSNVLRLRWSMIDLNERKIELPGEFMKNRRQLVLPIHPELESKLRHYRSFRASDIVLGKRFNDVFESFRGIKKRAGLSNLVVHDLRHTASTWFHMRLPWNYAEVLLGRKIRHISGVYFHPPFWDLRDRVDTLPWIEGQDD